VPARCILASIQDLSDLEGVCLIHPHCECDISKLDYMSIEGRVQPRKGKWRRFSEEVEKGINRRGP
jgi:hypothetical protein